MMLMIVYMHKGPWALKTLMASLAPSPNITNIMINIIMMIIIIMIIFDYFYH